MLMTHAVMFANRCTKILIFKRPPPNCVIVQRTFKVLIVKSKFECIFWGIIFSVLFLVFFVVIVSGKIWSLIAHWSFTWLVILPWHKVHIKVAFRIVDISAMFVTWFLLTLSLIIVFDMLKCIDAFYAATVLRDTHLVKYILTASPIWGIIHCT